MNRCGAAPSLLGKGVGRSSGSVSSRGEMRMYRGQSGQWSWFLHRLTGIAVLLFLLIHIVDITLIGFGPKVYNASVAIFSTGIVRLISLALIAAVLYHAFNGVRIILI